METVEVDNEEGKLIDNFEVKRMVCAIFEKISRQKKYKADSINTLQEVLVLLNNINNNRVHDEEN